MLRLFGIPESEIALTLRLAEEERGIPLEGLEITTCMRRGEIEIVTRYEPEMQERYDRFAGVVRERHADTLFSDDEGSVDEQVARLLTSSGRTIATAESCTGGLLAGRLTELPGSSAYVLGGLVVYSDEAKTALAGVDPALVAAHGACRRRSPRRWPTERFPVWARTWASASPGSPGRAAARRTSPWGSCASRSRRPTARGSRAACSCQGRGSTCATGRRPWRCTWSAACCWASATSEALRRPRAAARDARGARGVGARGGG